LAEEAEEARNAGRDPEALDQEAAALRLEEAQLRAGVESSRNSLAKLQLKSWQLQKLVKSRGR
jgi:chromosome segregation protein